MENTWWRFFWTCCQFWSLQCVCLHAWHITYIFIQCFYILFLFLSPTCFILSVFSWCFHYYYYYYFDCNGPLRCRRLLVPYISVLWCDCRCVCVNQYEPNLPSWTLVDWSDHGPENSVSLLYSVYLSLTSKTRVHHVNAPVARVDRAALCPH